MQSELYETMEQLTELREKENYITSLLNGTIFNPKYHLIQFFKFKSVCKCRLEKKNHNTICYYLCLVSTQRTPSEEGGWCAQYKQSMQLCRVGLLTPKPETFFSICMSATLLCFIFSIAFITL